MLTEKYIAEKQAISYLFGGKGPALVLLHGFCENKSIWRSLAQSLTDHYTLIVPDLPGFGRSDLPETADLALYAAQVKHVLDHEHVKHCIMVGHSMGGYATLAFAEQWPEMLRGFGLFHSVATPDDEQRKKNRQKTIEFVEQHGVDTFVRSLIVNLYASDHQPDSGSFDQLLKMMADSPQQGVIMATRAMMDRPDRMKVLHESSVPVLFVVGEKDQTIPADAMLKQASETPYAMIELLRESGHLGMLEEPEKSLATIQRFMEHCLSL